VGRLAIAAVLLFILTVLAYAGYVVVLGQSLPASGQIAPPPFANHAAQSLEISL
jgi:hypothetical protein